METLLLAVAALGHLQQAECCLPPRTTALLIQGLTNLSRAFLKYEMNFLQELSRDVPSLTTTTTESPMKKVGDLGGFSSTNLNKIFDGVLTLTDNLIGQHFDPITLPDVKQDITVNALIPVHVEIGLQNGQVIGLSSLKRVGPAEVKDNGSIFFFTANLEVERLQVNYGFVSQLNGIGPSGSVTAGVLDTVFALNMSLNTSTLKLNVERFGLKKPGKLDVKVHGFLLADYLINGIIGVFTQVFNGVVMILLEDTVRKVLKQVVSNLDVLHLLG